MTQVFLVFFKEKDEYAIQTIGMGHRLIRIPRPAGATDEEFKTSATSVFFDFIKKEQVAVGEIIESGYIF